MLRRAHCPRTPRGQWHSAPHYSKEVRSSPVGEGHQRIMESSTLPHDARWRARYDDIPRAVSSAREKYGRAKANGSGAAPERNVEGVSLDSFHAYMPMHQYIFAPTGEMWPA